MSRKKPHGLKIGSIKPIIITEKYGEFAKCKKEAGKKFLFNSKWITYQDMADKTGYSKKYLAVLFSKGKTINEIMSLKKP